MKRKPKQTISKNNGSKPRTRKFSLENVLQISAILGIPFFCIYLFFDYQNKLPCQCTSIWDLCVIRKPPIVQDILSGPDEFKILFVKNDEESEQCGPGIGAKSILGDFVAGQKYTVKRISSDGTYSTTGPDQSKENCADSTNDARNGSNPQQKILNLWGTKFQVKECGVVFCVPTNNWCTESRAVAKIDFDSYCEAKSK